MAIIGNMNPTFSDKPIYQFQYWSGLNGELSCRGRSKHVSKQPKQISGIVACNLQLKVRIMAGWWFGTWLLFFIYIYIYISMYWECHHPNWRSPSFFRGVGIPPTSIYIYIYIYVHICTYIYIHIYIYIYMYVSWTSQSTNIPTTSRCLFKLGSCWISQGPPGFLRQVAWVCLTGGRQPEMVQAADVLPVTWLSSRKHKGRVTCTAEFFPEELGWKNGIVDVNPCNSWVCGSC